MPASSLLHAGRWHAAAGVFAAALLLATGVHAALDRIVAIVNDDVITESQLAARLTETRKQLAGQKIALPPEPVLQRQMLEQMVVERLQLQMAERAGIRVSDADVERAIETLARRNKLDKEGLQARLKRDGVDPPAFRDQIRNQLLIEQLIDREIRNRITVSDPDIDTFLENQESRAAVNVEYELQHIFLAVPESASPAAIQSARTRATEILSKLRQGADFSELAIAHSQAGEALQGGQLGWKMAGQLPELFLGALRNMQKGAVSEILRSPSGFHILKLQDRRGGLEAAPVTETRARHILVRQNELVSREEARAKLLALRARIEHGEDFAPLARAHSEDPGSAARGGELGWAVAGQFVPEFERTMNALKPGELSQPVQSAFGWHLIQVLERREQGLTQERLRAQARAQIGARLADERLQQWLRQLRDEAYVEFLLEELN